MAKYGLHIGKEASYEVIIPEISIRKEVMKMGIANDMRNLTQEIQTSYDARVAGVEAIRRETAEMRRGFQREHREMATALQRSLAEAQRLLAQAESQRRKDFKLRFGAIQQRVGALRQETSDLLAGFRREIKGIASAWQNMASTLARKRAALIVPPKVPQVVEVVPEVPPVVEVVPKIEEVAPPEVVEEVPMEERVLQVITDHPGGIKLTGIGEVLDVEWRTLIPVVRKLLEEEKIEKVEDLYYLPGLGKEEEP